VSGPVAARLGDRLHLQHGPIDLIIGCDPGARAAAFAAAMARFASVLGELVAERPALRVQGAAVQGPVARRMAAAVAPHRVFVTPMAAVAGAVADEVLAAMRAAAPVTRAYVNNGGDIALHLGPGHSFRARIAGLDGADLGLVDVQAGQGIGGMATSGLGGRSLTMGIAQSVTVLAPCAATADAAATLIANAVDVPGHPGIVRQRACDVVPDSDLGQHLVTRFVGGLTGAEVALALSGGAAEARRMQAAGVIHAAILCLRDRVEVAGHPAYFLERSAAHA